jgi:hypothetical protein
MSLPHVSDNDRDEIQRAKNSGWSDELLAGNVGCSVAELRSLMGWKSSKPVKTDASSDLRAVDRKQTFVK